jgi:hypothetical protein
MGLRAHFCYGVRPLQPDDRIAIGTYLRSAFGIDLFAQGGTSVA